MTYRVGNHYAIHVYEDNRPVATFHDPPAEAARFVATMNAADTGSTPCLT